ncbi:MAG: ABC transporter substrate-binding protein [Myxococcota bacterium]
MVMMFGSLLTVSLVACMTSSDDRVNAPLEAGEDALPARVVSLAPAITQVALQVRPDVIVGYDNYSERHQHRDRVTNVGDMRALAPEPILALKPTLVLHNGGVRPPEVLQAVRAAGVSVVEIPHERSLDGVRTLIRETGKALGADTEGVVARFDASCVDLPDAPSPKPGALFIYVRDNATMSMAGSGTAAHAMMTLAGLNNVLGDREGYTAITAKPTLDAQPDWLVFTTKGLGLAGGVEGLAGASALDEFNAVREGRVASVDDSQLLAFGLDTCEGVRALARAVRRVP